MGTIGALFFSFSGRFTTACDQLWCQVTLKLLPPLTAEGWAFTVPLDVCMTISSGLGLLEIATPLAVQLVKLTVPKLASGSTPELDDGASAIHSAEPRAAPLRLLFVVNVQPLVLSLMVNVKLLPLFHFTSAVNESPGETAPERFTGAAGYISYQA